MGKQLLNEICWYETSFIDNVSSKIVKINERLYWVRFALFKTYCTLLFALIYVFQIIGKIMVKLESYFYSSFVCLFTKERGKWDTNWDTVVGGKNVALEWVLFRWKEKNNAKQNGGCHPIEAWVIEDGFACIKCHWFYIIFWSIILFQNYMKTRT